MSTYANDLPTLFKALRDANVFHMHYVAQSLMQKTPSLESEMLMRVRAVIKDHGVWSVLDTSPAGGTVVLQHDLEGVRVTFKCEGRDAFTSRFSYYVQLPS